MANRGRPYGTFKYNSARDLQKGIDAFFAECEAKNRPCTMTGLALALNIDRKTLLNYGKTDKFFPLVKRARDMCQQYAEARLFDRDGANGAKFALTNNYEGWSDKLSLDQTIQSGGSGFNFNINVVDQIAQRREDEQRQLTDGDDDA